jgi:hypothetical protein
LICWNFVLRENYQNYIRDLQIIKDSGYVVLGVTSDWHGSLVSAVKQVFGNIPHQRCLVHTQKRCETLLTKGPKTEEARELLKIAKELNHIKTKQDAKVWIKWIVRWKDRYENLIKERTYATQLNETNWYKFANESPQYLEYVKENKKWWYTHKNLRSAYRVLTASRNNLFLYLDYIKLDKDTNGLESEFSHLKQKINMHRGLTRKHKIYAMFWYVFLTNWKRNIQKKN